MRGPEDRGPADRAGAEMGARHGRGDGRDDGFRSARGDAPGAEALLAAALRGERADPEGERRAVAAFRAALAAEPGRAARTRRRDDWRPRGGRHAGRSLKTALSVLLASLTLGGVAYAAMGGGGTAAQDGGQDRRRPPAATDGASVRPVATPPAAIADPVTTPPGASAPPDRPATARDAEARCRAYERLEGRGKALDATAWQRLVAAAGGEENVPAYCAEQGTGRPAPGRSHAAGNGAEGNGAEGTGAQGNGAQGTGAQGNGAEESSGDGNGSDGNSAKGNAGRENGTGGNAAGQAPGRDR
ncbi:hypothetical protein [Streptomyces sp. NPDC048392]|uniref:hypothetical protein n=1 Tax=Streptomyces sp. NPDC048392 TaxID=3365543 RepID=UPI003712B717